MSNNAQKKAIETYRSRLSGRGIVRFELHVLEADRDLIRALARELVKNGDEASRLRRTVKQAITGKSPKPGGVLAALRRSPLIGADLDLGRSREEGRKVDL